MVAVARLPRYPGGVLPGVVAAAGRCARAEALHSEPVSDERAPVDRVARARPGDDGQRLGQGGKNLPALARDDRRGLHPRATSAWLLNRLAPSRRRTLPRGAGGVTPSPTPSGFAPLVLGALVLNREERIASEGPVHEI